jgi:hypothetical protein
LLRGSSSGVTRWGERWQASRAVDEAAGMADQYLTDGGDTSDRPWATPYGWAHQQGDLAYAYTTFATVHRRRRLTDATGRHEAAIDNHADRANRSRVMCLTRLAAIDVSVGDFEHGITTGWEAADAAGDIQSWRLGSELTELAGALLTHRGDQRADELAERVASLVGKLPQTPRSQTWGRKGASWG